MHSRSGVLSGATRGFCRRGSGGLLSVCFAGIAKTFCVCPSKFPAVALDVASSVSDGYSELRRDKPAKRVTAVQAEAWGD